MAHNVESMMYVGEVPWHGLGERFAEPPATIKEAMQASGLNWKVRLEDLYMMDGKPVIVNGKILSTEEILNTPLEYLTKPNGEPVSTIQEAMEAAGYYASQRPVLARAVVRESDGAILGHHVGMRFQPLQNQDAFEVFQPLLDSGRVHFETAGSLMGGTRVWILAVLNGDGGSDKQIIGDDVVRRYLLLSHGHDGKAIVSYGLTPVRVVCWNTLSAAIGNKASSLIKVKHTENARSALKDATAILDACCSQFDLAVEAWRELAKKPVATPADLHDWARLIIGVSESTKESDISTRTANRIERLEELYETGIGRELSGDSWWTAYNAVTQYLSHEAGRNQDTRLTSLWYGANKLALDKALAITMVAAGLTKASTGMGRK